MKKKVMSLLLAIALLLTLVPMQQVGAKKYKVDKYGELYSYDGNSNVVIKKGTSAIDVTTFYGITTKSFSVAYGNNYFKTMNGVLFSKDGTILVKCPSEKEGTYIVPSTVRKICSGAFYGCSKLTSVSIPNTVKVTGSKLFAYCSNLKKVNLPEDVTTISSETFYQCYSLSSISFSSKLESVESSAFEECLSLKSIEFPETLSYLGDNAFCRCRKLQSVKLSKKVEDIEKATFSGCENLVDVSQRQNVSYIAEKAFYQCKKLRDAAISSKVNRIGDFAFFGCPKVGPVKLTKDFESMGVGSFSGTSANFTVETGNESYSSKAGSLYNADETKLIQASETARGTLNLPSTVNQIGGYSMSYTKYSHIVIPEGVKSFSVKMIQGSRNLQTVQLPSTITRLSSSTSYGDLKSYNLPSLMKFEMSTANKKFTVLQGAVYTADHKEMCLFPCGRKGNFALADGCRYLSEMLSENKLSSFTVSPESKYFSVVGKVLYSKNGEILKAFPLTKTTYEVPAGVTSLGYLNAIRETSNLKSFKVKAKNKFFYAKDGVLFSKNDKLLQYPVNKKGKYSVPLSTETISYSAFNYSKYLSKLTITKNVRRISSYLFELDACPELREIKVNTGNLSSLKMYLSTSSKLKKITLPSTIRIVSAENAPNGMKIYGWDNTGANELARDSGGIYIRRGLVPGKVRGVRVKKIIDRYQLSWYRFAGANGYQIMSDSQTILTIRNPFTTSTYIPGKYKYSKLYIRAYTKKGKKKTYGKSVSFVVGY